MLSINKLKLSFFVVQLDLLLLSEKIQNKLLILF